MAQLPRRLLLTPEDSGSNLFSWSTFSKCELFNRGNQVFKKRLFGPIGRRLVVPDESTEQWRPPNIYNVVVVSVRV